MCIWICDILCVMEYFADRAEPSNWSYNKSSEAFWTSCTLGVQTPSWKTKVSTLSGYGFGAFGSLLVPICLMAMHKNPCTAKNTDTMQEGQGTVFLPFLQQLFFCHTCASQWRRLHQPASRLYFDFRAWALVFLELSCGHFITFLHTVYYS